MNQYTIVSKKIGHSLKKVIFPSLEETVLTCKAALAGDVAEFEKVFNWYRHLPCPVHGEEENYSVLNYLQVNFSAISKVYQGD